jgi:hypothetical protein
MERPRYPAELRYVAVQTVRLKCKILEDGSVAEMVFEDGPERLLPLARAALARWRYEPVRLYDPLTGQSTPVPVITIIDLRFDP